MGFHGPQPLPQRSASLEAGDVGKVRDLVAAVTDGRERDDEPLVEAVARELRNAPIRHLKAV